MKTINFKNLVLLFTLCLSVISFTSCSDDEEDVVSHETTILSEQVVGTYDVTLNFATDTIGRTVEGDYQVVITTITDSTVSVALPAFVTQGTQFPIFILESPVVEEDGAYTLSGEGAVEITRSDKSTVSQAVTMEGSVVDGVLNLTYAITVEGMPMKLNLWVNSKS